jgi:C4-dicarboxylate-specific signal transduction histidine kinase
VISRSQASPQANSQREDFSEYVAHLQLHMTLQTRKLLPNMTQGNDQRSQLLQETQAEIEKQVSRQIF